MHELLTKCILRTAVTYYDVERLVHTGIIQCLVYKNRHIDNSAAKVRKFHISIRVDSELAYQELWVCSPVKFVKLFRPKEL